MDYKTIIRLAVVLMCVVVNNVQAMEVPAMAASTAAGNENALALDRPEGASEADLPAYGRTEKVKAAAHWIIGKVSEASRLPDFDPAASMEIQLPRRVTIREQSTRVMDDEELINLVLNANANNRDALTTFFKEASTMALSEAGRMVDPLQRDRFLQKLRNVLILPPAEDNRSDEPTSYLGMATNAVKKTVWDNGAKQPLERLAPKIWNAKTQRFGLVGADAYLERQQAHQDADALTETNTANMRWTGDGKAARTGLFAVRKLLAGRDILKTLALTGRPTRANIGSTAQKAAWVRLLAMLVNAGYQAYTHKKAYLTEQELQDLAAYNYHRKKPSRALMRVQNMLKNNANLRFGTRLAGDGAFAQVRGKAHAETAGHALGTLTEFTDIRQRYKFTRALDALRKEIARFKAAHPNAKAPQPAAMTGGMGDMFSMLGGGGDAGGMDMNMLQQLMGGGDPAAMQQMMQGMDPKMLQAMMGGMGDLDAE